MTFPSIDWLQKTCTSWSLSSFSSFCKKQLLCLRKHSSSNFLDGKDLHSHCTPNHGSDHILQKTLALMARITQGKHAAVVWTPRGSGDVQAIAVLQVTFEAIKRLITPVTHSELLPLSPSFLIPFSSFSTPRSQSALMLSGFCSAFFRLGGTLLQNPVQLSFT